VNNEIEAYVGELRMLREKVVELQAEIIELKSKMPRDAYLEAQLQYDRFDG
jgi:hypothetical protein